MFDYLRKPRTRALLATFATFTLSIVLLGGLVRLANSYPDQVFGYLVGIGIFCFLQSTYSMFLTRYEKDSQDTEN